MLSTGSLFTSLILSSLPHTRKLLHKKVLAAAPYYKDLDKKGGCHY
jgi:hypothetical protein